MFDGANLSPEKGSQKENRMGRVLTPQKPWKRRRSGILSAEKDPNFRLVTSLVELVCVPRGASMLRPNATSLQSEHAYQRMRVNSSACNSS